MVSFNKPFHTGKEIDYIKQVIGSGNICGNGNFTNKCQSFFIENFGFKNCFLTTSCTDALEMCALLANIKQGDEVIVPSYTFVSTAMVFVRQGAKVVFADSHKENPNINAEIIEPLITPKTKAVVVMHYGGIACDMDRILEIAKKYNLVVIEDAACAIDSFYISPRTREKKALGSIGHLSAFSFHETKNIQCGEGGLLVINDEQFSQRAEVIWQKGTNKSAFIRREVDRYDWTDIGSSFLPSEYTAAFLYAQLQELDVIQNKRKKIWNQYYEGLKDLSIPFSYLPSYTTNNAHLFYLVCNSYSERNDFIEWLKNNDIQTTFHYSSLQKSDFIRKNTQNTLKNTIMADYYSDCLVRLPLYYELNETDVEKTIRIVKEFYKKY